ncbi:conjugal transfer protein TrbG/VirB9/CagX [Caballeronia turbans]|nr:conjugal transfer protein TrbG/VirB9/CagX [Caballeronia turbans]
MTASINAVIAQMIGAAAGQFRDWPPAAAKKAASDSPFNAAIVAGDPMSPTNPFNGGADPLTMPSVARIGVFNNRDQIYRVLAAPLKLTTIELEKGEKLIADPAMCDSVQCEQLTLRSQRASIACLARNAGTQSSLGAECNAVAPERCAVVTSAEHRQMSLRIIMIIPSLSAPKR